MELVPEDYRPHPSLEIGTGVHAGIAKWHETGSIGEAHTAAVDAMNNQVELTDTLQTFALIDGYAHNHDWSAYEWLGMEVEFSVGLKSGINLLGKVDGLLSPPALYELKTTKRIDASYIDHLRFDLQLLTYLAALNETHYRTDSVVYDIIQKPALRRGKKESESTFLERYQMAALQPTNYETITLCFPIHQILRWELNLDKIAQHLLKIATDYSLTKEPKAIKNPDACYHYNRACPFLELCINEYAENETPEGFVKLDPFSELTIHKGKEA